MLFQCARAGQRWPVKRINAESTMAASTQRRHAIGSGPKAGTAMRISGKDAPQTADRNTSWAKWRARMGPAIVPRPLRQPSALAGAMIKNFQYDFGRCK